MPDKTVDVTFTVRDTTDPDRFREALAKIYDGTAEDPDVAYVLDHVTHTS